MTYTFQMLLRISVIGTLAFVMATACGGNECDKAGDKVKACYEALCKKDSSKCIQDTSGSSDTSAEKQTCDGQNLEYAKQLNGCKLDPNTCVSCEGATSTFGSSTGSTTGSTTSDTTSDTTSGDTYGDTYGDTFGDIYSSQPSDKK